MALTVIQSLLYSKVVNFVIVKMEIKVTLGDKVISVPEIKIRKLVGNNITIGHIVYKESAGSIPLSTFEHYCMYPNIVTDKNRLASYFEQCNMLHGDSADDETSYFNFLAKAVLTNFTDDKTGYYKLLKQLSNTAIGEKLQLHLSDHFTDHSTDQDEPISTDNKVVFSRFGRRVVKPIRYR